MSREHKAPRSDLTVCFGVLQTVPVVNGVIANREAGASVPLLAGRQNLHR